MIRAYPGRASVLPGERLVLHVATSSRRFRVHFYRWHDGFEAMHSSSWQAGERARERGAGDDWDWPAYEFPVPAHWRSAVYIAHFEEAEGKLPLSLALGSAAALFVVRGARHGGMLYKLPLATWHAYNLSGGCCYDCDPPASSEPPGARVSLARPGGGIGGPTWGAPDHYDAASRRQSFAHWDARFIRWLARQGYIPEFCTDLDLDADPQLALRYRLLVASGHDAYWTETARGAVEDFIAAGGNAAWFAARLCWWRVHLVEGRFFVCHQGGARGAFDQWWPAGGAGRPEDHLAGASHRHGGAWWDGARQTGGFIVQRPDHWVFAGTGLRRGDAFGADTWPPLAGCACDGAPLDTFERASGKATLSVWADEGGTPAGYQLLAACPLDSRWQALPPREHHAAGEGVHAATLGLFERGGTVFSAGTTDWAQVLADGRDRQVERITRNVLDRLLLY
ncbi:N,N-dimethylformamidase beta subunit family domain-containing protein [Massilia sp. CMS3.1]|uniref:N,N-dimethylformamidase beta subunit family domain-containing protein n=1 Tax=Massilia sp. CMS3.1 TaxID=3373083 RepID=UPI003EE4B4DF